MDISTIIKILGFVVIIGLFFSYSLNSDIFSDMQGYINNINIELLTGMDSRVVFLISLLIFFIVLSFIFSFLNEK